MASDATLNVPKDVLEPIIQAQVAAAVLDALGPRKQVLEKAIAEMLTMKVDSNGQRSHYNSSNDTPWIMWALQDCIQKAAKEAITEYLAGHKDEMKAQIVSALSKRNSPLAKQLADRMVDAITQENFLNYRMNISIDSR
jgi:hypothetical protein